MDKNACYKIVRETFQNPFDKERFLYFIKNLLNKIDESKAFHAHGYVPEIYKTYVKTYERLGTYTDPEGSKIDVVVVYLQKETSLERARTSQRNFIARYLKDRDQKDAGLVAFVSPNHDDWRFSLVKMDYKFEEGKTGRIKVKEEFTPARRWSFLVGKSENSHTAQSRLVPVMELDEINPTLANLEEAFNIETVTKEFFLEYRDLFIRTKEALDVAVKNDAKIKTEFEIKNVNTVDFAKKLLGQIVFLYFLQKKGWFGVGRDAAWGTGSKKFLRELFEGKHDSYDSFFDDILEPLFYEALRIGEERKQDDYYYSRFKCKIPFLNGGLFDPIGNYDWARTDIQLPDKLFSNRTKTLGGDVGNGILDIFDRYNFTVKEDEPLEKEVAIDPELLGKAYEKFNAIRPDNFEEYKKSLRSGKKGDESKFNKQFGVYYSPREKVHYMCQQSLINYLFTELNRDKINYQQIGNNNLNMFGNEVKEGQLDITIEHRENPGISKEDIETLIHLGEHVSENEARVEIKGKETTTYSYKLPESIRKNAALIDRKLADITVCDPAVGSGAFPVGMMSEIVRTRNVLSTFIQGKKRTPYDFKRQCIEHSLYGVDIDPGAVEIAKLRLWLSLVVDEENINNIKPLPNLDYKIVCGNSLLGYPYKPIGLEKIEKLKELFIEEVNPTRKTELRSKIDDAIYGLFRNTERSLGYKVTMDFRINFSEVFRNKDGFDVVIANPPWGSDLSQSDKMRLKIDYPEIDSSTPNSYAYFLGLAKRICNGSIAYVLPDSILIKDYSKTREYLSPSIEVIKWFQNVGLPDDLKPFENVDHDVCLIVLNSKITENVLCSLSYYNGQSKSIDQKEWVAKKSEIILKEYDYVFNLLLSKADLGILSKIHRHKEIARFLQCHEGIHTGNSREVLFKSTKENKYCRPLFYGAGAGDAISNYTSFRSGWYVDYRSEIINKSKGQYASLRDERIFKYPKIYITRTGNPFKAFLDDNNYASNNFFSLQYKDYNVNSLESLKIIIPFIVCKLSQYFIRTFAAPRLGNIFVETKILHLLKFRTPDLAVLKNTGIVNIVNKILSLTQSEDYPQNTAKQAQFKEYEKQIDRLVYELYGLTEEEIEIVEGTVKKLALSDLSGT